MTHEPTPTQTAKEALMEKRITLRNGYWYYFQDGDNEIAVHGSAVNGKERVYFNDELLIDTRGFGFNAQHFFERDGHKYEALLVAHSVLRGAMECILIRDGQIVGRETKAYVVAKDGKMSWWKSLGPFFIAGFLAGFAGAFVALLTN
ncbi:MAG: hypothetical protein HWE08_13665 [Alphaproteobacteria bacterium]|nr:hypothetical protein [Alphaproteobacteria bacterium]